MVVEDGEPADRGGSECVARRQIRPLGALRPIGLVAVAVLYPSREPRYS